MGTSFFTDARFITIAVIVGALVLFFVIRRYRRNKEADRETTESLKFSSLITSATKAPVARASGPGEELLTFVREHLPMGCSIPLDPIISESDVSFFRVDRGGKVVLSVFIGSGPSFKLCKGGLNCEMADPTAVRQQILHILAHAHIRVA